MSLAAVVGLCGAATFAALGGARRTASAFDRHLAATDSSQLYINANPYQPETIEAMRALPGVASVQSYAALPMARSDGRSNEPIPGSEGDEIVASLDGLFLDQDRTALMAGELPDPQDPTRVLVSRTLAHRLGLKPGDTMHFVVADPRTFEFLRSVTVSVAGVGIISQEVASDDVDRLGRVIFTPGFLRQNQDLVVAGAGENFTYVWSGLRLGPGVRADDVKAAWERRGAAAPQPEGGSSFYRNTDDLRAKVQRSVRPQVVALATFGTVAALVSLLLIAQATRRTVRVASEEADVLRALGATRAGAGAAPLLCASAAAAVGGLLAVGGAAGLSVLTPVGVVRRIDPDPGWSVDPVVAGLGPLVLLAAAAGVAAWSSMRASRPPRALQPHERLQRVPLPVPVRVGVEFLFDQRSGIGRSAIGGAVIATVALVATLTMSQSTRHLVETPRLYGNDFDVAIQVGAGYGSVDPDVVGRVLDDVPEVIGWSTVGYGQVPIDGPIVPVMALRQGRTTAGPTLLAGRAPMRGEVVLGRQTLELLGKAIGDSVQVRGGDRRIVGTAVFPAAGPALSQHPVLGTGAWVDGQDLEAVTSQPASESTSGIFLRVRPGTDTARLVATIEQRYGEAGGASGEEDGLDTFAPLRPAELVGLKGLATVPLAFSGVLAAGALAALALALVAAVQRGRGDLALLKTFGFTKGQTYATIASQATATIVVGGLIGVPCGLAAGRLLWSLFAADLGVVPEARSPLLLVAAAGVGGLLAANLVALVPGRTAARSRPAEVLRRD